MSGRYRVTWQGREVQNPLLRVVVATAAIAGGILGICGGILAIFLVAVTLPITFPLDRVLKALGRRGFVRPTATGYEYVVDAKAFRRQI